MSKNDIRYVETGGRNSIPTDRYTVASGTPPTIEAGEPTKATDDAGEVILLVDADLTIGTDKVFTGVAAIDSTETASAAGYVDLYVPLPDIKWEIAPLTAGAVDTQTEIDALIGEHYIIDLTSSAFTMDTGGGTGANNAFLIVGGDANDDKVHFRIRLDASALGRGVV